MGSLLVTRAGWQTTVQDRGRWGRQADGIPVAGPMDPFSHRLANALVGNDWNSATLEAAFVGPELEFEDERVVAVTGAEFSVTLDGRPFPRDEAVPVTRGARLRFGDRNWGCRAYVAVSGGVMTPPVLGSRATDLAGRLGGIAGRALVAGDRLPLGPAPARRGTVVAAQGAHRSSATGSADARLAERLVKTAQAARAPNATVVRVLPGPHLDWFSADALDLLQSASYELAPESNRIGYRLRGPAFDRIRHEHFPSDATPVGSVQVPAPGALLLLMADHQTTGGYPKIATVLSADLGAAGQLAPGDHVQFAACRLEDALAALAARERALEQIEVRSRR
jgi:antagonist of KipI